MESLEQARKKNRVFPITDIAIQTIPMIVTPMFSIEENIALTNLHKSLLQFAKRKNEGREVLFITRNLLQDTPLKILGTANCVSYANNIEVAVLKRSSYASELTIMHNHPTTRTFSYADIATFIFDAYVGTSTVISNQGQVFILQKNEHFQQEKANALLNETFDVYQLSEYPNDEKRQEAATHLFLKKAGKAGIWYATSKG